MNVAVTKEIRAGECRVALVPNVVSKLVKAGLVIRVEAGAGAEAFFSDSSYKEAGAEVVSDVTSLLGEADVFLKVGPPQERNGKHEVDMLREGTVLIGFLNPFGEPALVKRFATRKITAFSMELIPRISRAQSMDALSSQASVGGYKAVLLAANKIGKFFPMLTTAAGTIMPAKVLVIGVGVAGLQAIATARRLGAVVEAFDIRPQTKQEVESLGAKFIEVKLEEKTEGRGGYAKEVSEETKKKEREILANHIRQSDIVITAAQVPGKKAPLLVTEEMIAGMKEGSVIVDMAAEQGGNCALTKAGQDFVHNGVTIMGPVNLPSMMPYHASQMYSRNISNLLLSMVKEGKLSLDLNDEVIKGCLVTHQGKIVNETVLKVLGGGK